MTNMCTVADKLVTIIVPVYNLEHYLSECLESILKQTYTKLQILLINDGSTDRSPEIIRNFTEKDERIHCIDKKINEGLGAARNDGIALAAGKYILFVDGDDYLHPETVEQLYHNYPPDCDIYMFNAIAFDHFTGSVLENPLYPLNTKWFDDEMSIRQEREKIVRFYPAWLKIYTSSFLKNNEIRFAPDVYGEDVEFWLRCLLKAKKIRYRDQCYYFYRKNRPDSIMGAGSAKNIKDRLNNFDILLELSSAEVSLYNYFAGTYIPYIFSLALTFPDNELNLYARNIIEKLGEKYG